MERSSSQPVLWNVVAVLRSADAPLLIAVRHMQMERITSQPVLWSVAAVLQSADAPLLIAVRHYAMLLRNAVIGLLCSRQRLSTEPQTCACVSGTIRMPIACAHGRLYVAVYVVSVIYSLLKS